MKLLNICVFSLLLGATAGFLFQDEASIQPEDPYLVTGDDLQLKCSSSSLDPRLNASHMYFNNSLGNIPEDSTTILTSDTIQLLITNVTKQIGVLYTCSLNESSIGGSESKFLHSTFVTVYDPPKPIENFECISQNFDSMTCSWCENEKDDYVSTELHYKIQTITPRECLRYDSVIPIRRCMCDFLLEVPPPDNDFKRYMTYNMTVVSRLKATLYPNTPEANATFIIVANPTIVRPNPVSNLTQQSVYINSVTVSWKSPFTISFALIYELLVESQWPDELPKRLNCTNTEVNLTGLLAATHYNISVRCVVADQGRYWSNYSSLTVVTKEDVPAIPPSMAAGSYRRVPCPGIETCDELHVYWAPPTDQKLTGGHIVSYTLTSEGGTDEDREPVTVDGDKFQAVLTIQKNTVYNISVAAATAVGLGPASSFRVTNGRGDDVPSPPVMNLVERSGGSVLFDWNQVFSSIALTGYTLLGCEELGSSGECKADIWHIDIPPDRTNYTLTESGENDLYALTANSDLGSSGMPEDWICVYYDNQRPSGTRLTFPPDQPERGLMMTWTRMDCGVNGNKARVASYTISYRLLGDEAGVPVSQTVEHPTTSLEINGLLPYTNYSLTILATSVHGLESMLSASVFTTTRESVPLSPDNVTVLAVTSHTVSIQWSPTAAPNGLMQAYHVLVKDDGNDFTAAMTTPENTNTTVGDLYGFMTYTVEVLGENGAGLSQGSNPLEFTTPIAAPTEIRMTNVTVISLNYTLVVVWSAPYPAHGPLSYYIVHVNWTRHGEPDLVIVNETDGHFSMAVPCNDDGVYNVGVTVSAVNVDEGGKHLPGPPSLEKIVQVCKDPGKSLWWVGLVIAAVVILISVILLLSYIICRRKTKEWMDKLTITVPEATTKKDVEEKQNGETCIHKSDYYTIQPLSPNDKKQHRISAESSRSDCSSGIGTAPSSLDCTPSTSPVDILSQIDFAVKRDVNHSVTECYEDLEESDSRGIDLRYDSSSGLDMSPYAKALERSDSLKLPTGPPAPIIYDDNCESSDSPSNSEDLTMAPFQMMRPLLDESHGGAQIHQLADEEVGSRSCHPDLQASILGPVDSPEDCCIKLGSPTTPSITDYSQVSRMDLPACPLQLRLNVPQQSGDDSAAKVELPNHDENYSSTVLPQIDADTM